MKLILILLLLIPSFINGQGNPFVGIGLEYVPKAPSVQMSKTDKEWYKNWNRELKHFFSPKEVAEMYNDPEHFYTKVVSNEKKWQIVFSDVIDSVKRIVTDSYSTRPIGAVTISLTAQLTGDDGVSVLSLGQTIMIDRGFVDEFRRHLILNEWRVAGSLSNEGPRANELTYRYFYFKDDLIWFLTFTEKRDTNFDYFNSTLYPAGEGKRLFELFKSSKGVN